MLSPKKFTDSLYSKPLNTKEIHFFFVYLMKVIQYNPDCILLVFQRFSKWHIWIILLLRRVDKDWDFFYNLITCSCNCWKLVRRAVSGFVAGVWKDVFYSKRKFPKISGAARENACEETDKEKGMRDKQKIQGKAAGI